MVYRPRDLADRMRAKLDGDKADDGFERETFTLPVEAARIKACEILDRFPAGGYATVVEQWRQLPDGQIEFTMRRQALRIELVVLNWAVRFLVLLGIAFTGTDNAVQRCVHGRPL